LGVFALDGVETRDVAEWRCVRRRSRAATAEGFVAKKISGAKKISSGGFCFLNKKLWE
jgi:hypothetical protein